MAGLSASRLLFVITTLPLLLAGFAFFLQQHEGYDDPGTWSRLYGVEEPMFPGGSGKLAPGQVAADCSKTGEGAARDPVFPNSVNMSMQNAFVNGPKLAICTSTSAGLDQVLPWLFYHKALGVETYFLFVEGKAALPNSTAVLESIPGVKLVPRTKELEDQQAKSRIWGENWLAGFFYQPCNYELFVKQSLNMEMAIVMARAAGMDWIIHIDTDELLSPEGTEDFSLTRLLEEVAPDIDLVVFPNYETIIERVDIEDPFAEVTVFKKNFDHVPDALYYQHYQEATRGNPNYFLTYGNGKSAARVIPGLRPNGAHRWHNYEKTPVEITHPTAPVLHYTYAKFSDLKTRKNRCGCKPTEEDVKKCFMLDFDRLAFIVASTSSEEDMLQFYKDHVVWSKEEIESLVSKGLFGRLYTPQVIIRGIQASGILERTIAAAGVTLDEPLLSLVKHTRRRLIAQEQPGVKKEVVGGESETDLTVAMEKQAVNPRSRFFDKMMGRKGSSSWRRRKMRDPGTEGQSESVERGAEEESGDWGRLVKPG